MSKPQKRCVFCGGIPATKGHIWPEWFERYLPAKASHHEEIVGGMVTFKSSAAGPTPRSVIRQGPAGSRKPRNTCLNCNGGWMSRLEQANVTQMGSLILGRPVLLSTMDQWLLSALLCLITVRLEFTDEEMQGVPVAERRELIVTGHAPFDTWRIWIARFGEDNTRGHWSRHMGMQIVSSPDEMFRPHKCNAQVTTMVIGELCAHLVSSSAMPVPAGYDGIGLTRIWPPTNFDIDSRAIPFLDLIELEHLHESLAASMKTA